MRRETDRLAEEEFDVLVVGGGILGAFVAWDAALRGLRVALVEKGDFAGGTSCNSLKILHGGLRYLRSLDLRRVRESIRERSVWLRIAPHLVEPLPVVLGAYRRSLQSRPFLWAAMAVADAFGWDRNRGLSTDRCLPRGRILSRDETVRLVPELTGPQLTGGALFHDAQMYSSERLVMEVLQAASSLGAALANYSRFEEGLGSGDKLTGGRVTDLLTDRELDIHARMVVNAAGPAWGEVARKLTGISDTGVPPYSLALNVVVEAMGHEVAFGLPALSGETEGRDPASGARQLFLVPWRNCTLIGTGHYRLPASPARRAGLERCEEAAVEPYVERFLSEINRALPERALRRDDVRLVHAGLLPATPGSTQNASRQVSLLGRRQVIDHANHGTPGAVSGMSVKFTTARILAEELVDLVVSRLGDDAGTCSTATTPLPGAATGPPETVRPEVRDRWGDAVPPQVLEHLVRSYGGRCHKVLERIDAISGDKRRVVEDCPVVLAQLAHGAEEEMAHRPEDLLYRRTEIGAVGADGAEAWKAAAMVLANRPTRTRMP